MELAKVIRAAMYYHRVYGGNHLEETKARKALFEALENLSYEKADKHVAREML